MAKQIKPVDYFSTSETKEVVLPDGVSSVTIKKLTEGERKKYQDSTTKEFSMDPSTQRMSMDWNVGSQKHVLLELSIVGWKLFDSNEKPITYSDEKKKDFLEKADPIVIDAIEKAINDFNPWTYQQRTVEEIEAEIKRLGDILKKKKEEEEKKM